MSFTKSNFSKQRAGAGTIRSTSQSTGRDIPQFFSTFSAKTFGKWRGNIARENTGEYVTPTLNDEDMQSLMENLIFQAGVDFETRPMVVICGSAFPDAKEASYDDLLVRILQYLDLYVESDYTVVLFAAGSKHQPSWSWIWKAYRSLSRKYRKNLKKLIVVHSNWFSKMLFSLAGSMISPKFFRKIHYVSTLSELAQVVPLTQIAIPPEVYQENLKYESEIVLPSRKESCVFGIPLKDCMGERLEVPFVIRDSIQYLRSNAMKSEGIFRRSPSSALLKQAASAYDRGQKVSLKSFHDPNIAAVLIKKFFRDLPEPVFPEKTYHLIRQCPAGVQNAIQYIQDVIIPSLPELAVIVLHDVLSLLHDISLEAKFNLMDSRNLALVMAPNLIKGSNPLKDVEMCLMPSPTTPRSPTRSTPQSPVSLSDVFGGGQGASPHTLASVLQLCIEHYSDIFVRGTR